jgi:hypothetical protein
VLPPAVDAAAEVSDESDESPHAASVAPARANATAVASGRRARPRTAVTLRARVVDAESLTPSAPLLMCFVWRCDRAAG